MKISKDMEKVYPSDFWYDLIDGGYIHPELCLEDSSDTERVLDAIKTLQEFRDALENDERVEYR